MSEARLRPRALAGKRRQDNGGHAAEGTVRTVAEWVTLGISLVLLLGLAAFLLYEGLQPHSQFVPVEVRILEREIRREGAQYILPLEVTNRGASTLRSLTVEVEYTTPAGKQETRETDVEYLGEHSRRQVFLYFDHDPVEAGVKAGATVYHLE